MSNSAALALALASPPPLRAGEGRGPVLFASDSRALPPPNLPLRAGKEAKASALPPLPYGEMAGVRGQSCGTSASKRASINRTASTRPSPQSSPRGGEEANANSEASH